MTNGGTRENLLAFARLVVEWKVEADRTVGARTGSAGA